MTTTDLIIIGAGPGGYRAAEYAAKQGLKVTIFEGSDVGGTCLNVGCIPTKTYVHSETFEEARERMAQVVPQLRAGVEGILSHPNITLIRENASFATTPLLQEGLGEVPGGGFRGRFSPPSCSMVLWNNSKERQVFRTFVHQRVLLPHRIVMHLTWQHRLFFSLEDIGGHA